MHSVNQLAKSWIQLWILLLTFIFNNWLQYSGCSVWGVTTWPPRNPQPLIPCLPSILFSNHMFPWTRARLTNPTSDTNYHLLLLQMYVSSYPNQYFNSLHTSWVSCNSIQFWYYLELAQTPQVKGSAPKDGANIRYQLHQVTWASHTSNRPAINWGEGEDGGSTHDTPSSGSSICYNFSQNTIQMNSQWRGT